MPRDFIIASLGYRRDQAAVPYRTAKRWDSQAGLGQSFDVVFDGVSSTVDYELDQLLQPGGGAKAPLSLSKPTRGG